MFVYIERKYKRLYFSVKIKNWTISKKERKDSVLLFELQDIYLGIRYPIFLFFFFLIKNDVTMSIRPHETRCA